MRLELKGDHGVENDTGSTLGFQTVVLNNLAGSNLHSCRTCCGHYPLEVIWYRCTRDEFGTELSIYGRMVGRLPRYTQWGSQVRFL